MLAYMVLGLHVVLLLVLGLLVILFRGLVQYMLWIGLAALAGVSVSGYVFYRKIKTQGKTVRQMISSPLFYGRPVELRLLGGLISLGIGKSNAAAGVIDIENDTDMRLLEDPEAKRIREITELARLLEKELITREEFEKAKQRIFR